MKTFYFLFFIFLFCNYSYSQTSKDSYKLQDSFLNEIKFNLINGEESSISNVFKIDTLKNTLYFINDVKYFSDIKAFEKLNELSKSGKKLIRFQVKNVKTGDTTNLNEIKMIHRVVEILFK